MAHLRDQGLMCRDGVDRLLFTHIPHPHAVVLATGGQLVTIGREVQRQNPFHVALQHENAAPDS